MADSKLPIDAVTDANEAAEAAHWDGTFLRERQIRRWAESKGLTFEALGGPDCALIISGTAIKQGEAFVSKAGGRVRSVSKAVLDGLVKGKG